MRQTRRSVLGGIGALTIGGGAIFGSGAFSQVEAERSVSVNLESDSTAYLSLSAVSGAGDYVTTTASDDGPNTIEIDIGSDADNIGVNADAMTRFDPLVDITNNSSTNISSISFSVGGSDSDLVSVIPSGGYSDTFPGGNSSVLGEGQSVTLGLEIDLRDGSPSTSGSVDANVTIIAETA